MNIVVDAHAIDRFCERSGVAGSEAVEVMKTIVQVKAPKGKRWKVRDGRMVLCGRTQSNGVLRVVTVYFQGSLLYR